MSNQFWMKASPRTKMKTTKNVPPMIIPMGSFSSIFGQTGAKPSSAQQQQIQSMMKQLGLSPTMWGGHQQQAPKKKKLPKRRILCKIKLSEEENDYDSDMLIVHRGGTCYWKGSGADEYFYWKLAHSDIGPLFLFSDNYNPETGEGHWETEWNSGSKKEVKIAEHIARALADLEVEKVLKGEYDESKSTKTSDNPEEGPEHAEGQDGLSGSTR